MEKVCKECGEKFSGRADAKFCSDYCRSSHNNKLNGYNNSYVRKVNSVLSKNRKILTDLNPKGKSRVKKEALLNSGFDFNYQTNVYVTKAGKTYHFCYEQGYLDTEDGWLTLVTKHEYV